MLSVLLDDSRSFFYVIDYKALTGRIFFRDKKNHCKQSILANLTRISPLRMTWIVTFMQFVNFMLVTGPLNCSVRINVRMYLDMKRMT